MQWERAWYGLPWPWRPGQRVQVEASEDVVELWVGAERVTVHPRAQRPGQRFPHPRQWEGLSTKEGRPRREPRAMQWPAVKVEERSLEEYAAVAEAVSR
ncbi:MAG: hypothetical protein IMX01_09985 [Limnochordaceae bacterium]|nr:hypothetical protein [Limnochordaceae bacterium]